MRQSLLFQIVKQILVNLVVHLFYERRFWSMEHRFPHPRDTQLPFDMSFTTMFYTCHVTEVGGGGTASYKKKFKTLYSLTKKYNEKHKNIVK